MIAPARQASTVCLVRDGSSGIEILMVQRGSGARFMANAWVFPGGVVDDIDATHAAREAVAGDLPDDDYPWAAAAFREVVEEVDIWLATRPMSSPPPPRLRGAAVFGRARDLGQQFDGGRLAYFANWVTPTMIPIRFDTRFYAAEAGLDTRPDPDPSELAGSEWLAPALALELGAAGERLIPLPTKHILSLIAGFPSVAAFMEYANALVEIVAVRARGLVREDGLIETVLPDEPGFELLEDVGPQGVVVSEAARRAMDQGHLETP